MRYLEFGIEVVVPCVRTAGIRIVREGSPQGPGHLEQGGTGMESIRYRVTDADGMDRGYITMTPRMAQRHADKGWVLVVAEEEPVPSSEWAARFARTKQKV